MSRTVKKVVPSLVAAALALSAAPRLAHAEVVPPVSMPGERGQLWIDQISGFRVTPTGLNYYGPIGFSVRSFSEKEFTTRADIDDTVHASTFWIAPSADYFVTNHFSVGGLIMFATTSNSADSTNNGVTTTVSQPTTNDFVFLPRFGGMIDINEQFGIWPRGGIGYASHQQNVVNGNLFVRDTLSGFILDIDCGFVWRFTENFFVRAAPEISFLPGGSHSVDLNGTSQSNSASAWQFAGVTGIGGILPLM